MIIRNSAVIDMFRTSYEHTPQLVEHGVWGPLACDRVLSCPEFRQSQRGNGKLWQSVKLVNRADKRASISNLFNFKSIYKLFIEFNS